MFYVNRERVENGERQVEICQDVYVEQTLVGAKCWGWHSAQEAVMDNDYEVDPAYAGKLA